MDEVNEEIAKQVSGQSSTISSDQKTSSSTEGTSENTPETLKRNIITLSEKAQEQIFAKLKSYTDEEINKVKEQSVQSSIKIKTEEDKLKDKLEQKIEDSKLSVIETLGLFVALFTFISIDVQILKSDLNLLALAGFVLVTLGALSFFVICLNLLVTKSDDRIKTSKYRFVLAFIITILLLVCGVWLIEKK